MELFTEYWKNHPLSELEESAPSLLTEEEKKLAIHQSNLTEEGPQLLFFENTVVAHLPIDQTGVTFSPLKLKGHTGTFVYIPKGVQLPQPLVNYFWKGKDQKTHSLCTLVIAEKESKVDIIDLFFSGHSHGKTSSLHRSLLFAGPGAQISYKRVQNWNEDVSSTFSSDVFIGEKAATKTIAINLNGQFTRTHHTVHFMAPGGRSESYALTIADNQQIFEQQSKQLHEMPHSTSELLYKNVLWGESAHSFSGLVKVGKQAEGTKAYQANRNLLLSEKAVARTHPYLEIENNEVSCSHGATTGKLDEEELFYMRSRGIPLSVAYELAVFGFCEEIFKNIKEGKLLEHLRKIVQTKLRNHKPD